MCYFTFYSCICMFILAHCIAPRFGLAPQASRCADSSVSNSAIISTHFSTRFSSSSSSGVALNDCGCERLGGERRLWDRIEGLGVGDLVPRSVFGAGLSNRIWHTRAREWAGERVFACRIADYDFEARFPRKGQTRTSTCANGSSGRPTGMVTASVVRRGVNSFAFQFNSDI